MSTRRLRRRFLAAVRYAYATQGADYGVADIPQYGRLQTRLQGRSWRRNPCTFPWLP